jgi:hypothetical protein
VGQAIVQGDTDKAADVALQLGSIFPHRFYLELQRAGRPEDETQVAGAVALAARLGLPVVATHPVQFLTTDDYEAHEARVCISEGEILANPRRVRRFTREQYFKSSAQMSAVPREVRASADISAFGNARAKLNQGLAPMSDRSIQLDSVTMASVTNGTKALFHDAGQIKKAFVEGYINRSMGLDWYENERILNFQCGCFLRKSLILTDLQPGKDSFMIACSTRVDSTRHPRVSFGAASKASMYSSTRPPLLTICRTRSRVMLFSSATDWSVLLSLTRAQ